MSRSLQRLSDADLVTIAEAAPDATAADLARTLDRPYFTVAKALRRIRRDGWVCWLSAHPCLVCGETVLGAAGRGRRLLHPQCERQHALAWQRASRRRRPGQSTPYVQRWRQDNPEALAIMREREKEQARTQWPLLSKEEQDALLAKLHAADQRDYAITKDEADHGGEPWDADEDQYILEHPDEPARETALRLGRTSWAVRHRRSWLHKTLGR